MNYSDLGMARNLFNVDYDSLLTILCWTDPKTVCYFSRTCRKAKSFVDTYIRLLPRPAVKIILLAGDSDVTWRRVDNPQDISCKSAKESLSGLIRNNGLLGAVQHLRYAIPKEVILSGLEIDFQDHFIFIKSFLEDLKVIGIEIFIFQYYIFTTKILSNINMCAFEELVQLYSSILHLVKRLGVMGCFDMYKIFCRQYMNDYVVSVDLTTYIRYERLEYVLRYIAGIIKVLKHVDGDLIKVRWVFDGFTCLRNIMETLQEEVDFVECAELIEPLKVISGHEIIARAGNNQTYQLSFIDNLEEQTVEILFQPV